MHRKVIYIDEDDAIESDYKQRLALAQKSFTVDLSHISVGSIFVSDLA